MLSTFEKQQVVIAIGTERAVWVEERIRKLNYRDCDEQIMKSNVGQ